MRRVIVLEFISLDGVIQSPGRPDEDTSGGFTLGGWTAPYTDDVVGATLQRQMSLPFDLLLGRKTFEIWETWWPERAAEWPGAAAATKYVASQSRTTSVWQPTVFLRDAAQEVARIKQQPEPDLHVYGSGDLVQTLLRHDLVDAFWLKCYPLVLGSGKRLFAEGTIPAAFKLTESSVSPSGVSIVEYERAGAVTPGSF